MFLKAKPIEPASAVSRVVSDEDLWRSFQNGEDAAFNMLYARYADRIYVYLKLLLTGQPQQLDDVFQEAWILIFKERSRFTAGDKGSFGGWLFRVAHNFAISLLRKDPHQTLSLEDLSIDTDLIEGFIVQATQDLFDRPSADEIMLHVVQAVEGLPLLLKEVFVLSEFDKLGLDQIADTLGISRTNAKVRLFRSRKMIRERLTKVLDVSVLENL
jgi:RNA polymerase sigma-70 factor (ECF subfamily)